MVPPGYFAKIQHRWRGRELFAQAHEQSSRAIHSGARKLNSPAFTKRKSDGSHLSCFGR